jgi:predicted Fe-S protein YdhL (DUF1289 family)
MDYRSELAALADGIDVNRYYDAWRLVLALWRSVWNVSYLDWRRYRRRAWEMFQERVLAAARTSGDISSFVSQASRLLSLAQIGANQDDREEIVRIASLSPEERENVMRELRDDLPMLVALVRRYSELRKAKFEGEETEYEEETE